MQVADTGRGLTAEDVNKLSKTFSKADQKEDVTAKSIGMGLVICKKIIQNNEGSISVTS